MRELIAWGCGGTALVFLFACTTPPGGPGICELALAFGVVATGALALKIGGKRRE